MAMKLDKKAVSEMDTFGVMDAHNEVHAKAGKICGKELSFYEDTALTQDEWELVYFCYRAAAEDRLDKKDYMQAAVCTFSADTLADDRGMDKCSLRAEVYDKYNEAFKKEFGVAMTELHVLDMEKLQELAALQRTEKILNSSNTPEEEQKEQEFRDKVSSYGSFIGKSKEDISAVFQGDVDPIAVGSMMANSIIESLEKTEEKVLQGEEADAVERLYIKCKALEIAEQETLKQDPEKGAILAFMFDNIKTPARTQLELVTDAETRQALSEKYDERIIEAVYSSSQTEEQGMSLSM